MDAQKMKIQNFLLGFCIDQLEQMVNGFVKQESINKVIIGNIVIMFLLYKDDVVLFANTSEDTQKHMHVIENLCMHTPPYDLILNSLPLIPWPWKGLLSTC